MTTYVEWQAFVGPYYKDYDWSLLPYGVGSALNFGTTLSGSMTSASTTAATASAASFNTSGGIWIGPNGSGQTWEYCKYTGKSGNTFTGLTRQTVDSENNGAHSSGARVYQFFPLDNCDDGELHVTEEMDAGFGVTTWSATISGVNFPQPCMRNGHIIVIQSRLSHTSIWTNLLIGFLDSPAARDNYQRYREWNVRIVDVSALMRAQPVKGVKAGNFDIAKEGTANGSTSLVLAFEERASNDYVAADPKFDAGMAIDKDNDTLWVGERFIGTPMNFVFGPATTNQDPMNNDGLKFDEIYINPPPGAPPGSRYIRLVKLTGSFQGFSLYCANGGTGSVEWQFGSASGVGDEEPIILCEDKAVFEGLHPLQEAAAILENRDWFQYMRVAGQHLRLRLGALNLWKSQVAWGDGYGWVQHPNLSNPAPYGTTIAVPGQGQTLRYRHDRVGATQGYQYWDVGMVRTDGYYIDTDHDQYVAIDLPGLGLKLDSDITATVPAAGSLLKIKDDSGPTTSGLPASGTIQIGSEQINYSAKSSTGVTVSLRGANSTTAAAHVAGDLVYILDSGLATDAHLISSIGWQRFNGAIYPKNFVVRRSNLPGDARSPEDANYTVDWVTVASITNNAANSWTANLSPSTRIKHLLIEIDRMTTDPARARLNNISAILDPAYYTNTSWVSSNTTAGSIIQTILQNAGLQSTVITVSAGTPALDQITTADNDAWTVVADLAEFAGCRLTVSRDSRVTIANDTFWTSAPASVFTWDETNVESIDVNYRNGLGVSQYKVKWRSANGATTGEEVYPATAEAVGDVQESNELIFANSTAAQAAAKKYFYLARYPFTLVVSSADGQTEMRPGAVHRVNWLLHDEMQLINRLYLVASVDHVISKNDWQTSANLMQIEREQNV